MDDEKLGFRFFLRVAGIVLAIGIIGLIFMLIFTRAIYAWGFLGAFAIFCGVLLLVGWWWDRRKVNEYYAED
jgi:uncharacterized membrane protein